MKLEIYSIKDIKVAFRQPIYFHNFEEAKRACQFAVNSVDDKNELYLAPQDFELWYLGEYDDSNGIIVPGVEFKLNLAELKRGDANAKQDL